MIFRGILIGAICHWKFSFETFDLLLLACKIKKNFPQSVNFRHLRSSYGKTLSFVTIVTRMNHSTKPNHVYKTWAVKTAKISRKARKLCDFIYNILSIYKRTTKNKLIKNGLKVYWVCTYRSQQRNFFQFSVYFLTKNAALCLISLFLCDGKQSDWNSAGGIRLNGLSGVETWHDFCYLGLWWEWRSFELMRFRFRVSRILFLRLENYRKGKFFLGCAKREVVVVHEKNFKVAILANLFVCVEFPNTRSGSKIN